MSVLDVTLKDVELRWKNFSGRADEMNAEGKRYFNVVLTPEMAEYLNNVELFTKSGKLVKPNVRTRVPKNGDGDPIYTLKVIFGKYPPEEMWRLTPRGKMQLNLDTVGNLDREYVERAKVMVTLTPYERMTNMGVSAYCKKLWAWIKEDDFDMDEEFQNLPIIGGPSAPSVNRDDDDDDEELPF